MRTGKLTELISTIDQYNGMLGNDNEYAGGAEVDINTDFPNVPDHATITEGQAKLIKGLLITEGRKNTPKKKRSILDDPQSNVLSFERFLLREKKGTPPNVSSYMGCLDNEEEEEE